MQPYIDKLALANCADYIGPARLHSALLHATREAPDEFGVKPASLHSNVQALLLVSVFGSFILSLYWQRTYQSVIGALGLGLEDY